MCENSAMLLTYIRSVAGSENAVDDIFQETMITAWKKLDEFDRTREFGPWLRGIAKNHALNYARKNYRDMLMCNESILEYIEQHISHVESQDGDSWKAKTQALHQCINDLPDNYRHAIRTRYLKELKPEEAMKYLDVPKETLKKRLQRAKKRLLLCIQEKGILRLSIETQS